MPEPSLDVRPAAVPSSPLADWLARLRAGEDPVAGVAVVLVVALVAGLFWYRAALGEGEPAMAGAAPPRGPGSPAQVAGGTGPASTTTTAPTGVVVHVAGAVARPGLYHLPSGARVADAVDIAGGPAPRADLHRLNLAARVADGQRVAVPRQGEPSPPVEGGGAAGGGGAGSVAPAAPAEPLDLNTAGQAELEMLPGVGPATARAILDERGRRNGFRSVRDLLRVPGIGERRFAELKDRVRV